MYKLIAIDVDGTLINDDKIISNKTKQAIKYARDKGIYVILSTGRIFMEAKMFSDEAGCNPFGITSSGAAISDFVAEKNTYNIDMSTENSIFALETLEKHNFVSFAYAGRDMILNNQALEIFKDFTRDEGFSKYRILTEDVTGYIRDNNIKLEKIFAMHGTFKNGILSELTHNKDLFITSSGDNNIEVVPMGANKGEAIKRVAANLNIKPSEIIAIGDSDNDYEMMQVCGVGVAMGNANDKIKAVADYITASNNDDGVAKAIYNFIK